MLKNKTHGIDIKLFWRCLSGFLLIINCYSVFAQSGSESGYPFITNYLPKTYQAFPQTWSVQEADNGIMYFGIDRNMLEYDGIKWRLIDFSTKSSTSIVRALTKDKTGVIYYGSYADLGYLGKDSLGQTITKSLVNELPQSNRTFSDIWSAYSTDEGIYFQSREMIFRFANGKPYAKREVKVWKPQTKFMYSFYVDGNYYVHQQGLGLYKMVNDSLVLLPGSEFLGKQRMQVMVPYLPGPNNEKQYLVGMFYGGLYIYNGKTFNPFVTKADSLFKSGTILYKALRLKNGNYVLLTTTSGIIIIDAKGNVLQRINRNTGLQDEAVYASYQDKNGTLWLGLDNGISRIEISSPLTKFTTQSGINAVVLSIQRFKGILYIGTSNGLLQYDSSTHFFEPVAGIPKNQIFSLLIDNDELLVGGDGLFAIRNKKAVMIRPSVSGDLGLSQLYISAKHPDVLYGGATFGMSVFSRKLTDSINKKFTEWHYAGNIPEIRGQVNSIEESEDGKIWTSTQGGGLYRFKISLDENGNIDSNKTFLEQPKVGEDLAAGSQAVISVKGINYFAGDTSIYTFNNSQNKFIPDSTFGKFSNRSKSLLQSGLAEDSTGRVWLRVGKQTRVAIPKPGGGYTFDSSQLKQTTEFISRKFYAEGNNILWICTTDGLLRYDGNIKQNLDASFRAILRHIEAGNESLDVDTTTASKDVSVSYKKNRLRFEYAAPFFDQEEKTQYQTWLEGFDKRWSEFDNNYYKEFTNLSPGKYHFHVRAKNIYGKLSSEAVYSFSILPPWYRTWWAYALYALIAIIIIYFIVNWQVRKLRQQHIELEKIVTERTGQLSQRVAELGVINTVQDGLVREMNMQSIYDLVGNRICELFDTQTVIIRTFDQNNENEEWQFAIERGERLQSPQRPLIWANKELIVTKQSILINKNYLEFAAKHGGSGVSKGLPPRSAIFVPMIVGDAVRGSVSLQNVEKENAFSDNDLRLLTTLTNSMSVALENARLFDETTHLLSDAKQRAGELATVNNISKALTSKLDANDLINLVGDQLKNLFKANIVYLALLNKKTNIISFPYQFGDNMKPMKLGTGLSSNIILKGEPLLLNKDVDEKTGELGLQRVGIPAASYLGVPIPVGDEIIGVLSVQSTEQENRFNENDLRLLSTIASSVGVALKNAQLFEDVQQAKKEAEISGKAAEKANEAKSAFLSTVSHELRTPLTSVLGFAKIIKKRLEEKIFIALDRSDPKTEKTAVQISENLKVVISEGERLTHLINDVLDLAKIEAGKMEWNQESVSLPEVVDRAIAATTSLFDQKDIRLVKQIDTEIPLITADNDKLIQVVINLLSNAVKFTNEGAVTCTMSHNDKEAIVSISDTGIGIAKEDYGAVFEQFKQVGGDTLTDKPKGTGLGLPICKEIVEHHGGRIWLESEKGKGSTFSFSLPLTQSAAVVKETPIHLNELMKQLKEQMVFSKLKTDVKNANILVVDDDDSIRSLLNQELSDVGYAIEEARDGKQALECIRKNRPDLIILDVMMPEINGFDVAAILKNDPQTMDIPIIILSIVQDKARGFRIGVDRYLTKPIDTVKLFEEVGNLLEQGKSKKKVMVVDEDSSAVRSLTEVLQTKGYIVVESDGKELVEKAISTQPDIIILNSVLSDKNEIVQSLRFEKGLENVLFLIYQ